MCRYEERVYVMRNVHVSLCEEKENVLKKGERNIVVRMMG